MNDNLEQMLAQLEEHGWEFKLRSRRNEGFIAKAWKPDGLSGGRDMCAPTPTEALSLALQDAIRRRRKRYRNLKRQRQAGEVGQQ